MENDFDIQNLYPIFSSCSIAEMERQIASAHSREEKVFFRTLINLKLQLAQEKVVEEDLL